MAYTTTSVYEWRIKMIDNALYRQFKAIGEIKNVISGASDIEDALRQSIKIIQEVSNAETVVIWYFDKDGDKRLYPAYTKGARTFVPSILIHQMKGSENQQIY